MTRVCSVDGCDSAVLARGWCCRHYNRWAKHGDPMVCKTTQAAFRELRRWIERHVGYSGAECLIWPFARHRDGRAKMGEEIPSRLMCRLAHGQPPTTLHEAAHSCGKGHDGCVHPQHLRWATRSENHFDKLIHGTMPNGIKHYKAVLVEEDIPIIRSLSGKMSQSKIAHRYSVSRGCIAGVIYRTTWKHIT